MKVKFVHSIPGLLMKAHFHNPFNLLDAFQIISQCYFQLLSACLFTESKMFRFTFPNKKKLTICLKIEKNICKEVLSTDHKTRPYWFEGRYESLVDVIDAKKELVVVIKRSYLFKMV